MLKEEPLNAYLAEIIRESRTSEADPEVTLSDGRMDIRCRVGSHIVGIECKLGYRPAQRRAAIADANRRLANGDCDVGVALLYPSGVFRTADDLRNGEVRVNVRSKPFPFDDPEELRLHSQLARWDTVSVSSFSDYLKTVPDEAGSPENLASMADVAIESAFDRFTPMERGKILHDMGLADANDPEKALKGLLTDLMVAIMFHVKLDVVRHTVELPHEGWNPPRVIDCINSQDVQAELRLAHEKWLEVDYKQILEWSCSVLDALPSTVSTRSVLMRIAQTARLIESSSGGQHHDLFGITFCQSVASAKNDGSMYTTIPAATLLTRLTLAGIDEAIDWSDFEQVTNLSVVDFACGTGTLLIAAANYILNKERTGRHEEVARALLERVVHGYDINNRAIFQSATGLGMISPSVAFREMHLYSMLLGINPASGHGCLGSLEMLEGLDQGTFNPPPSATRVDAQPAPIQVDSFDVAIMNPPFTVNYKRHHQFSEEVKSALQTRESELVPKEVVNRSGNSGAFVVLAEKHLDEDKGILGFVLPSAAVNGPAGFQIRKRLAQRFHIKYLVTSFDPERIFFSGNTDIGEILVIAGRKPVFGEPPPTTAVKLIWNPGTASSAVATADYILNGTADEHDRALTDTIPFASIEKGDWRALQFADHVLYYSAVDLSREWVSTIGDQFEVKGIGRSVRKCGNRMAEAVSGATPVLWEHDANHCNRLVVSPDSWVTSKAGHESELRRISNNVHRLKLPDRISLTSSCVTAVLTAEPSLGSAWQNAVPVCTGNHAPEDVERATAIILNSTLGKLATLLVRNNRKPTYPTFSVEAQRSIALPPIASMTGEQVRVLVDVFDEVAEIERKPFPEAHTCDVQLRIDAVVCQVLEYDLERCVDLRERLAREPMISNKPYRRRTVLARNRMEINTDVQDRAGLGRMA